MGRRRRENAGNAHLARNIYIVRRLNPFPMPLCHMATCHCRCHERSLGFGYFGFLYHDLDVTLKIHLTRAKSRGRICVRAVDKALNKISTEADC